MKIKLFTNVFLVIYFLALTFLVYYTMPNLMLHYYPYGDATIFEYFGYAMTKGEKLYVDLFDHKGPIIFFINYFGYIIGGAFGIKFIYLICYFVFLIYVYKISKLFTSKNMVSVITLLIITIIFLNIFESGLGLEGYMLPFITYSFYIYLDYFMNNRYNSLKIILVGFCFGIVFFTKYNMVGLWLILSVVVIILN
ncbi:glycosyltransferase family 39 protein, partial [Gemella sp. GH3]|uniref:glycosyltransferase family 39 protein n=1 Tax=unclassified Gemella TaxID=2624949 RepID=UPI0015CFDC3C